MKAKKSGLAEELKGDNFDLGQKKEEEEEGMTISLMKEKRDF